MRPPDSATLVPDFRHRPGVHCGSTAFADAARFAGLDWSEDLVFGLASGIAFYSFEVPGQSPSKMFHGRAGAFDESFVQNTGLDLALTRTKDFDEALDGIRALITAGEPVVAKTDLRFLPYYQSKAAFNGHKIVIAGIDDEGREVWVADTHFRRLQPLAFDDLDQAMTSDGAPLFWRECCFGPLRRSACEKPLAEAIPEAIHRASAMMIDEPSGFGGLVKLERLVDDISTWRDLDDAAWAARFGHQVIEKRGTGGGLFRRIYARFLIEAQSHADVPDSWVEQMQKLADQWTALAAELKRASLGEDDAWGEACARLPKIFEAEDHYHRGIAG